MNVKDELNRNRVRAAPAIHRSPFTKYKIPEVIDLRDEFTSRYHPAYRNNTVTLRL